MGIVKPVRKSTRLPAYDYSQPGMYFVTVCTYNRICSMGQIVDDVIELSARGRIVADAWRWLSDRYGFVALDEFVMMPNHVHGLIEIRDSNGADNESCSPSPLYGRKSLGRVIAAFKTVATRRISGLSALDSPVWQRGYYEHVVRSTDSLQRVREYIWTNPRRWAIDAENPLNDAVRSGPQVLGQQSVVKDAER